MSDLQQQMRDLDPERRSLLRVLLGEEPTNGLSAAELLNRVAAQLGNAPGGELLVYLHVPFCTSKCSFCDWVTDVPAGELTRTSLRQRYADALCRQIAFLGPRLSGLGYQPSLVYWGGGTPSRLEAAQLAQVADALADAFDLSAVVEHTVEASPDTLSAEKLEALRSRGVNRVSIGVQSFVDAELQRTGRAHNGRQAEEAVQLLRAAGFTNFNLDLILGLPDQQPEWLEETLDRTLALRPPHLTAYLYRPTPGTALARQIVKGQRGKPSLEMLAAAYERARARLSAAGYHEYITNYFALGPEHHFRGEEHYFRFRGDYVGFGSGANSLLGHHLAANPQADLHTYLAEPLVFGEVELCSPLRMEKILSAMREVFLTARGIDFAGFRRAFGFDFREVREHPYFRSFLEYYKYCGARFEEDEEHLAVSAETRGEAYLRALVRSYRELDAAKAS